MSEEFRNSKFIILKRKESLKETDNPLLVLVGFKK
jgi:hypothetical protein